MIHHVGVLSLASEALKVTSLLRLASPMELVAEHHIPEWKCTCLVYAVGGETLFEMVIPEPDSPLTRRIKEVGGTSLHHIALKVDDVRAVAADLTARGYNILTPEPVEGAMGWLVNFVHPMDTGVMIELVQETR